MVIGGTGVLVGIPLAALTWAPMQVARAIASWFRVVIETLGSVPFAAVVAPYFPTSWLAAAVILNGGALAGIRLRRFFWQRRVWAAAALAAIVVSTLLLTRPDGQVHVYALDVGTGSAVLIRTANGHQVLIDEGPDADRFAQAVGRALPPTARTLDLWLITGGRRPTIGAGGAALIRFQVNALVVSDPDAWSFTLRSLVQQAQATGVPVSSGSGPYLVDGVTLSLAADARSWLIQTTTGQIVLVAPETSWLSPPTGLNGVIFASGGPPEWEGPSQ